MTRIVVVDDHPVFRKGIVALLRASDIEVVGEAGSGLEALSVVADTAPAVVLMDLSMPELGGIEATERLLAQHPKLRVVVITLFEDEATVARALRAGASAYVTKQSTPEQILAAISAAESGALWLGPGVPRPFGTSATVPGPPLLAGLTARESAIADLVSRGLANPVIAERLHLSVKTVANYVSIITLKLGAADRADAARLVRATRDS
jgi:DNA-binding NarL/FixJ family response regulator